MSDQHEPDADELDYDDDWFDDDPVPVKEEPDCGLCYDSGCRSCEPTHLDLWRWSLRYRFTNVRRVFRRRNRSGSSDEPPF